MPSREFTNTLSTGCGPMGAALVQLAKAHAARGRSYVQEPDTREPPPKMDDRTPMSIGARGFTPLAAPGHRYMQLKDDVGLAEVAVMQAFSEQLYNKEIATQSKPSDERSFLWASPASQGSCRKCRSFVANATTR